MLLMHIPLTGTVDRQSLYRLIEKRPYTLSLSGHTHWQAHQFIDESDGWKGREPHHHIDAINAPIKFDHLWKSLLPPNLPKGVHSLEAITRDMYGREFTATRVLRVD